MANCPECERSNGPWYEGPCDHGGDVTAPLAIAIVESRNGHGWSYCPEMALPTLGRVLQYADEPGFKTSKAAIAAARRDRSILSPTFVLYPKEKP